MRSVISAVLVLVCAIPASDAVPPAGIIQVTATYPGADAKTVDETVIAPLFQQINGVEGMTRIESEARNDGTGTLTIFFEPNTDLNLAQVLVQNRANLALPAIPTPCRQLGIQVRKLPANPSVFWVALTSTDKNDNAAFLASWATGFFKREFDRVPGVVDGRVVGIGEIGLRVWLKPDRLRAYDLMASDVVDAIQRQNAQVAASWRPKSEEVDNVILKTGPPREVLRVKDVAEVEFAPWTGWLVGSGLARVNGKPAGIITVTAWPGQVTADKHYNIKDANRLLPGMRFDVVANRATDRLIEVEVRVPDSATQERTEKVVERATELIRGLSGKPDTVAFAEGRSPTAATILVKLPAKGGPTVKDVKKSLAVIPDAAIRVGSAEPGGKAFPVRLALTGPLEGDEKALREVVNRFVAELRKDPGVTELAVYPELSAPSFAFDIDREKCATMEVKLNDVFTTLQASLGGIPATSVRVRGRMLPVTVHTQPQFARDTKDLARLWLRNAHGVVVPLEKVITIKNAHEPPAIVRVNGHRAVIITAAPADGKTPTETAALCVKLAQEVMPKGYRVQDLTDTPLKK